MADGKRNPEEIRASIEANRLQLGHSVERLRGEVAELADWRTRLERNRTAVLVAAAVAGFVLGGGLGAVGGALRRRR